MKNNNNFLVNLTALEDKRPHNNNACRLTDQNKTTKLLLNTLLNSPPDDEEQLFLIPNKRDFTKRHVTHIAASLLINHIIVHVTTLEERGIEFNWLRSKNSSGLKLTGLSRRWNVMALMSALSRGGVFIYFCLVLDAMRKQKNCAMNRPIGHQIFQRTSILYQYS